MKFNEKLRSRRKELGLTQQQVADLWGIRSVNVSDWEKGKTMPEASKLPTLARRLGISISALMGESPSMDAPVRATQKIHSHFTDELENAPDITGRLKKLPVVGRVQAGPDGLLHVDDLTPDNPEGYMMYWTACDTAYALRIRGESMSPRYRPGEFVGVDPCAAVEPSDEAIILLKDGRRMIKRLMWMRDDQACFESVNNSFPNITLELNEIESLHLVLGNIPRMAFRSS